MVATMSEQSVYLALLTGIVSFLLGGSALVQRRRSFASWSFFFGMLVFSLECVLRALSLRAHEWESFVLWHKAALLVNAFVPGIWLAFSLSYSRGNYREFLHCWRYVLTVAAVGPPLIAVIFFQDLIVTVRSDVSESVTWLALSPASKFLNVTLLIGALIILANFERTFRAAIGTMRWRVKFLLLGLGLVFGARVYTLGQALLFSEQDPRLIDVEIGALFVGCILIGVAHLRRGLSEADVYPSHTVLQSSVTLVLAGCYLLIVGVLAQIVRWLGGSSTFHLQAMVVLAGVAGLGVLLLSERLRQRIKYFVSRHLRRPHHDFRQVWRKLTEDLASANNATKACTASALMISETFNALSVTVWLLDEQHRWVFGASTLEKRGDTDELSSEALGSSDLAQLAQCDEPFDLDGMNAAWAEVLKANTRRQFSPGQRFAVTLRAAHEVIGMAILADRVNRVPYTIEESELLRCLADQIAATLLNFRLGRDLALAKEMETFQVMSAFFVHDLKNCASSLNLLLQNLPRHFDNPEFREDALRALGSSASRIDELIARLSSFRGQLDLKLQQVDLNELIDEAIVQMGPRASSVEREFRIDERVRVDRDQIKSVITNLLSNAHDASPKEARILVRTELHDVKAVVTVADLGCGMTQSFIQKSLFRPFQTTKKKGIGIGMFQSRLIVDAHGGQIQVRSEPGHGTTFTVTLPISSP